MADHMDYKLVKHCPFCKKRFLVDRKKTRTTYCEQCQKKFLNKPIEN